MDTSDFTDHFLDLPLAQNGLIMARDDAGVVTNVPHTVTHHSPTGYEFGYGGSGPSDLALNALEAILRDIGYTGERVQCYAGTCYRIAWDLHMVFKWKFIAPIPRAGDIVPYAQLLAWVQQYLSTEATA